MRLQLTITHIPGSDLKIVDTLSRAPLQEVTETDRQIQKDTDAYVAQVIEEGYRRYTKLRRKTAFVNS